MSLKTVSIFCLTPSIVWKRVCWTLILIWKIQLKNKKLLGASSDKYSSCEENYWSLIFLFKLINDPWAVSRRIYYDTKSENYVPNLLAFFPLYFHVILFKYKCRLIVWLDHDHDHIHSLWNIHQKPSNAIYTAFTFDFNCQVFFNLGKFAGFYCDDWYFV